MTEKVTWEDISKVASEAFHLQGDQSRELQWAERAWHILEKVGATAYDGEIERLSVIIRFFALVAIYYDFFSIMYDESGHELSYVDWIDEFKVHPLHIGLLAGTIKEDVSDWNNPGDAICDILFVLTNNTRKEIYNLLLNAVGDINSLFVFLYRSIDVEEDEWFILNGDCVYGYGSKLAAFGWVQEGCYKYY